MARVFLTGASGFIGRALAAHLRAGGDEVTGMDRAGDPGAGVVTGDVAVTGEWQAAARDADVVIHTAAMVGMPSEVSRFWAVNVRGTRNAVVAARDAGARLVHVSSVVTFGLEFPDGVDETFPVTPTGVAYADTKIAAEQVVLQAHAAGEVEAVIVRPGDVYGPGSRPWTLLPVEMLRARRLILPRPAGIHSPVFVDDLVDGIARAARVPAAAGRVVTLSGGVGVPIDEFMGYYGRALGRRVPQLPRGVVLALARAADVAAQRLGVPNELTPDAVRYLADRRGTYAIATARELLGWTPATPLEAGMERTLASL